MIYSIFSDDDQRSSASSGNDSSSSASSGDDRSSSSDDYPKLPVILPDLPNDIVSDILKLLPVKSLLRFRSVCHSLRDTVDDPSFVALHLSHSAHWHLAFLSWGDTPGTSCFLFAGQSFSPSHATYLFRRTSTALRFVDSRDGLICVTRVSRGESYGKSFEMWNLFTKRGKVIPRSGPEREFTSGGTCRIVVGFAFDASKKDYKIVRILHDPIDDNRCLGEIFSLYTESWTRLDCEVPSLIGSRPAVFLKGNLHWFVSKDDDLQMDRKNGSIIWFDVANEVFDEMPLSQELKDRVSVDREVILSVLNELLTVCTLRWEEPYGQPQPQSICSVWIMGEYGVPNSWTKKYTLRYGRQVSRLHGFTRNGELLMDLDKEERASWNPIVEYFEFVHLARISRNGRFRRLLSYSK
ncbi:hypothetical protein EUGRSUZ_I00001 [Eucalyptus grandis]|uniref:Uncharacterized protein n=2 Tax=Eucalyptus grandis TaxID=71139 RepID=A0ACC3JBH5_EUCGR|nr:hypothetical protein EUGRSUZ_I00001 [Eucalyptus grandis]